MTVIVGLNRNDRVWLGADSACSHHNVTKPCASAKLFRKKCWDGSEMIVGGCGSYRAIQVVQHKLDVPELRPDVDVGAYFATTFADAIRKAFKDSGVARREDDLESSPAAFLIGWQGRLFKFQVDYSAIEPTSGFDATGSGEEYALGALHVLAGTRRSPVDVVRAALGATAEFCPTVSGPFVVERL